MEFVLPLETKDGRGYKEEHGTYTRRIRCGPLKELAVAGILLSLFCVHSVDTEIMNSLAGDTVNDHRPDRPDFRSEIRGCKSSTMVSRC